MNFGNAEEEETHLQTLRDQGFKVNFKINTPEQKDFNRLYERCKKRRARLGMEPLFRSARAKSLQFSNPSPESPKVSLVKSPTDEIKSTVVDDGPIIEIIEPKSKLDLSIEALPDLNNPSVPSNPDKKDTVIHEPQLTPTQMLMQEMTRCTLPICYSLEDIPELPPFNPRTKIPYPDIKNRPIVTKR